MSAKRTETELRQFFEHWATLLNTFCRLYLGQPDAAEHALRQGFFRYIHCGLPLRFEQLPATLMSIILEECDETPGAEVNVDSEFEAAVLGLLPQERSIFILHGVLGFQLPWVAAVISTNFCRTSQLWLSSLVQLRMVIVRDACSSLTNGRWPTLSQTADASA